MSTFISNNYLAQQREYIFQTYRDLHDLAEPSWQEEKTSCYLKERLQQAGFTVLKFAGHYGLVAEIPGETADVVALRADIDALVQEVDGIVKANHSCGHDAHSTMVLHTALALAACQIRPHKTIRFIFQPAKEKGEGALQMFRDGAMDGVTLSSAVLEAARAYTLTYRSCQWRICRLNNWSKKGLTNYHRVRRK